jgi:hypothetical protein
MDGLARRESMQALELGGMDIKKEGDRETCSFCERVAFEK